MLNQFAVWHLLSGICRYSWTAVMLNQFEANDPTWLDGQTVLEYYGIAGQSKWANFGYVTAFFWFFT
jgi:hypothetical protein